MTFASLRDNLARVRDEVAQVQAANGLRHDVRLIGVTKGHAAAAIVAAAEAGLGDIGENRVQEAVAKHEALGAHGVEWHLIGHLQTNKAKFVPGIFNTVHSVDSVRLVQALSSVCERSNRSEPLRMLIQVNVAGEEQKTGCKPEEAARILAAAAESSQVTPVGLMTMAPLVENESVRRRVFADLRALRERLEGGGVSLPHLSMGMSSDYRAAVAEGATMLRLGTVLFGERVP